MICAVSMVRDEADIIGYTLLHLFAEGIDHVIVADNLSTDRTRIILESFVDDGMPVTIIDDHEVGYYQDTKMTGLARIAAEEGADWVLPFDADELWYSPHGTIADALTNCSADVIRARGWDHIVTLQDGPGRNPYKTARHRRTTPQKLPKVAFRPCNQFKLHMGNHDVDHPGIRADDVLELRHIQYRSFDQLTRKVRQGREAYEASTLHWNFGTHWRSLGSMADDSLRGYWDDLCNEDGLICDPAPYRARV